MHYAFQGGAEKQARIFLADLRILAAGALRKDQQLVPCRLQSFHQGERIGIVLLRGRFNFIITLMLAFARFDLRQWARGRCR